MPRRNSNNNPNALSDSETAFTNTDDALTAAADATQTDANNGDPPTTTTHSLGSLLEHNSVTLLVLSSTIKNASSREQRIADAVTNGLTRPHTSEVVNSNSRSISTRREWRSPLADFGGFVILRDESDGAADDASAGGGNNIGFPR